MVDRTTWLPGVLPSDLKNIPLVTVQTADKGVTIRERLYESQMRLATSSESNFDIYKQYVTVSNFNVSDLPEWDGLTRTGVEEKETANVPVVLAPNPSTDELTIRFENSSKSHTLTMVNSLGQVVYSEEVRENGSVFRTISTKELPAGSYLISLRSASGIVSKNVTVLH